jgi:hypothetical protein
MARRDGRHRISHFAFIGAIFFGVDNHGGIDGALKAWSAIGTIIGLVTGAIPSYFYQEIAQAAEHDASARKIAADDSTIAKVKIFGFANLGRPNLEFYQRCNSILSIRLRVVALAARLPRLGPSSWRRLRDPIVNHSR